MFCVLSLMRLKNYKGLLTSTRTDLIALEERKKKASTGGIHRRDKVYFPSDSVELSWIVIVIDLVR